MDHADAEVTARPWIWHLDLLAMHFDRAGIRLVDAREHLHQRRLPRAVLTDERVHLSGSQLELRILQCLDAWEMLVDPLHPDEEVSRHGVLAGNG